MASSSAANASMPQPTRCSRATRLGALRAHLAPRSHDGGAPGFAGSRGHTSDHAAIHTVGVAAEYGDYAAIHTVAVAAAAAADGDSERIAYVARTHGPHYNDAAVADLPRRLRQVTAGLRPWQQWHAPVPSCRHVEGAAMPVTVLDFGAGVEGSGHVEGSAAVGKWDEVRLASSCTPRPRR